MHSGLVMLLFCFQLVMQRICHHESTSGMLQETHFLVHHTQPLQLQANKEGYTVLAMSRCPEEVPSESWRLGLLSQQPLQGWSQLPCTRQDLFEGDRLPPAHAFPSRFP